MFINRIFVELPEILMISYKKVIQWNKYQTAEIKISFFRKIYGSWELKSKQL